MTPEARGSMFVMYNNGTISNSLVGDYWNSYNYVRPVVSLANDVIVTGDGDGSMEHPYQVTNELQ